MYVCVYGQTTGRMCDTDIVCVCVCVRISMERFHFHSQFVGCHPPLPVVEVRGVTAQKGLQTKNET